MKFTIAALLGLTQGVQIDALLQTSQGQPDISKGLWWTKTPAWKNVPNIANGMAFLADGCRFRLHGPTNYRTDGNGRMEWDGQNLILYFDTDQRKQIFYKKGDGSYASGQWTIRLVDNSKNLSLKKPTQFTPKSDKCTGTNNNLEHQWDQQSALYKYVPKTVTNTMNPDLANGQWWVQSGGWKKHQGIANGMPIHFDGCKMRFHGTDNKRADGNGKFEWQGSNLVMRLDSQPQNAIDMVRKGDGYYSVGKSPQNLKLIWHGEGSPKTLSAGAKCASSDGSTEQRWQSQSTLKQEQETSPAPSPTNSAIPDLGKGKWHILHDHWKNIPSIAKGMDLLVDGCRWRLHSNPNKRPDSNGKLEWHGDDIVLYVDNRPEQKRFFKKSEIYGKWQEGNHPNAWTITWDGDDMKYPTKKATTQCATSYGREQHWINEAKAQAIDSSVIDNKGGEGSDPKEGSGNFDADVDKKVNEIMEFLDLNKDGTIEYRELRSAVRKHFKVELMPIVKQLRAKRKEMREQMKDLRNKFKKADVDRNRKVTKDELKGLVKLIMEQEAAQKAKDTVEK